MPTLIPWQAIHSDAPLTAQLAILNGYDRPVEEKLRATFEGWKLHFEAYPELKTSDTDPLPKIASFIYAPLYLNGKPSYNASEAPLRYALDPDANLPLFQTITPDGKRIVFTLVQLYNPQNIADKQNRAADETLLVPAALGELTDEQIRNLADFFNNGPPLILNPAEKRGPLRKADYSTLVLATEGDIFKLIAADPKKAYEVGIKHPAKYVDVVANLSLMQQAANLASLDSLLGMEGNDIGQTPYEAYKSWGNYHYSDIFAEGFSGAEKSPERIYERPIDDVDKSGNKFYISLDPQLEKYIAVIIP
jgi:hypothetical protein